MRKVRLPLLSPAAASDEPLEPLTVQSSPFFPPDLAEFQKPIVQGRAFRTSSYVVYIDLPQSPHHVLLIHGYTGAYDKVTRSVADYLRSREARPAPKPLYGSFSPETDPPRLVAEPSADTLRTLRKRGYLTPLTPEEEESFFVHLSSRIHHAAVRAAPLFIVMPTYQCNLRCPYCFQDHLRNDPSYRPLLRPMDVQDVDRIFKGMASIDRAHGIDGPRKKSICLFGGEPLLRENRPVIERILDRAMKTGGANISAITNATELDHYADLLGPDKIGWLQVTLDGPEDDHEQRRVYPDGRGTFSAILKHIALALSCGAKVSARINVDRRNLPKLPQLFETLAENGLLERQGFAAYAAQVHTHGPDDLSSWDLASAIATMKAQHPLLATLGGPDDGLLDRARDIFEVREDPLRGFRTTFCSAHTTMYVIDPSGDIYACWERTGDKSIRLGSIGPSGDVLVRRSTVEFWRTRSVISNAVCRKCRYAMYCGGGCAVLAEHQHGHMHSNHCDAFSKRFRTSVAAAYSGHLAGTARAVQADRVCDL